MDVEVPDYFTCDDLLKAGLDHFNDVLLLECKPFQLPLESILYALRIAKKKNGKPDSDMPPMRLDQPVLEVQSDDFCISFDQKKLIEFMQGTNAGRGGRKSTMRRMPGDSLTQSVAITERESEKSQIKNRNNMPEKAHGGCCTDGGCLIF